MPKFNDADMNSLRRLFNQIETQTYGLPRENLEAVTLVPSIGGISPWADSYTYKIVSEFGMAKIISDHARDLPPVSRAMALKTVTMATLGDSYEYTDMELEAWLHNGVNISRDDADTARRKIDELIDYLILFGSPEHGFTGFFNNVNVPTVVLSAGAGGGIAWSGKTLDEKVKDLMDIYDAICANTAGARGKATIKPDTVALPSSAYNNLLTTRLGNGDGMLTQLDYVKNVFKAKGITNWIESADGDTAGASGNTRIVMYKKSPEYLGSIVPIPFRQKQPQEVGLGYIVNCYARSGGTVFKRPTTAAYADGV